MSAHDDSYWHECYHRFLKETGDPAQAEDLTQELKLKLLLWQLRGGPIRDQRAAHEHAFHQVLGDWLRRKYRRLETVTSDGEVPEVPDSAPNPEESYAHKEKRARIRERVRRHVSGRKQRILVDNWHRDGKELATLMKTTAGGVRSCRMKLLRRLRRKF